MSISEQIYLARVKRRNSKGKVEGREGGEDRGEDGIMTPGTGWEKTERAGRRAGARGADWTHLSGPVSQRHWTEVDW